MQFLREPHHKQLEFIDLDNQEQCYGGAKGGGKTIALAMKVALLSFWYPGNRILIARKNMSDLKDSTLAEFFNTVPDHMIINHHKTDRQILIRSRLDDVPSEVLYRGLGDLGGQDWEKIKGLSLGGIAIDEPSEIGLEVYLQLTSQLRWTLPKHLIKNRLPDLFEDSTGHLRPKYMCMVFTNPEPGWVKERFVVPAKRPPQCAFVQALPRDNPHLPPDYLDQFSGYPAEWIAKYINGDWTAGEGQVFTMYDEAIHCIDSFPRDVLKRCTVNGALDVATTGVTAVTLDAFDTAGNECIFKEYYEKNLLISQHARNIKQIFMEYGLHPQPSMLIDPAALAKTIQKEDEFGAVLDEYAQNGIICSPAWNRIEVGIDSMKEVLTKYATHAYPWWHPRKGEMWAPAAFFVKGHTVNLRREIEEYKKKIKADGKVEWSGSDHALDTWRYIRNSKPRRPHLAAADISNLPTHAQVAIRTHSKWAKKWDEKSGKNSGTFWRPAR